MSEPSNRGAASTRTQILHAAAELFAERPYGLVSLEDIIAKTEISKGSLYFHFRTKYALAVAVIDERSSSVLASANELLARKLSALESLIDLEYFIAVQDVVDVRTRAAMNLVESIGRMADLQSRVLGEWSSGLAGILAQAMAEGDIVYDGEPRDLSRFLVSLYMGTRRISSFTQPEQFLAGIERSWRLVLHTFADPERVDFFTEFVKRRTALASGQISSARDH